MAVLSRVHPLPKGTWRVNRSYSQHTNTPAAIDYGAPVGTTVYAADAGKVIVATDLTTSYGTHVKIRHANGYVTVYAHMVRGSLRVKVGDSVLPGTPVGKLGYTGNVSPAGPGGAHLHFEVDTPGGGTMDPAVWLSGAGSVGGSADEQPVTSGGAADEKIYPLPKPQNRPRGSGESLLPYTGAGSVGLLGDDIGANITQLIDAMRLDAGTESVAQLTFVSADPDLALSKSKLADIGSTLIWQFGGLTSLWDISTVDVSAANATVSIAARSRLAKRLRRTVTVRSTRKVSPSDWVRRTVRGAGGSAVVQKSNQRGEISQADDTTEWDMLSGLASSLNWSWVEYGGEVIFGSRHWAWSGGPKRPHHAVSWRRDSRTDVLDAELSQTDDDPDNAAVGSLTLPWNRGILIRPWDTIELVGLGRWSGAWLIEQVGFTTDGGTPVDVQVSQPRKPAPVEATSSTSSSTRTDTPPTRDKTSVKYARWFARQLMSTARYGWSDDANWDALEKLWTRESGWNYQAENRSSGAYGIPQSLPASKMASAGKDWRTNPETQIKWGLGYIKGRYGSPKRAWAHSQQVGWY